MRRPEWTTVPACGQDSFRVARSTWLALRSRARGG